MRAVSLLSITILALGLPITQATAAPTCSAGYTYLTQNDVKGGTNFAFFGLYWKADLPCCRTFTNGWNPNLLAECVKLPPQPNSGGAKAVCPPGSAKSCGAQHNVTTPNSGSPRY